MQEYDVGDVIQITVTLKDASGTLADPSTVALSVHKPRDAAASAVTPLTHSATGVYSAQITLDQAGVWRYEWTSTGNPTVAEGGEFYARASWV